MQSQNQSYILEIYSEIAPYICNVAHDYLNAYLVFDENATNGGGSSDTMGCWRLIRAPKPNSSGKYRAVAAFTRDQTSKAPTFATIAPGAFDAISDGRGGTIVPRFIDRDMYDEFVEPPEGNWVMITGQGVVSSTSNLTQFAPYRLEQHAFNWKAANFGQNGTDHPLPDPTNPDYTDGVPDLIYQCDPSLTTQDAVDWRCRRVYDLSCHTRHWYIFAAPLVLVTNPDDTLQIRPRLPRFGDIILVDGRQCVLNACHIQENVRHTTRNSLAIYEAFDVPALGSADATNALYRQIVSVKK